MPRDPARKAAARLTQCRRHLLMDVGIERRLICAFCLAQIERGGGGRRRDAPQAAGSRRRTRHPALLARSVRQRRSAVVGALFGLASRVRSSPSPLRCPPGLCRQRSGRDQDEQLPDERGSLAADAAVDVIRDSVRVARQAASDFWRLHRAGTDRIEPKVAGSVGPYGACLADMSEYTGAYADSMSEQDLIRWHRPRLMALLEEGVDYLAVETIPSLKEAKAVLQLVRNEAPDTPTWISFSCKDGKHLCHGEPLSHAMREIWNEKSAGLMAVGVNCTDRELVAPLLASLGKTDTPLVVYPHRQDDAGTGYHELASYALEWISKYPNIVAIGGCCAYHPEDIAELRKTLYEYDCSDAK